MVVTNNLERIYDLLLFVRIFTDIHIFLKKGHCLVGWFAFF